MQIKPFLGTLFLVAACNSPNEIDSTIKACAIAGPGTNLEHGVCDNPADEHNPNPELISVEEYHRRNPPKPELERPTAPAPIEKDPFESDGPDPFDSAPEPVEREKPEPAERETPDRESEGPSFEWPWE